MLETATAAELYKKFEDAILMGDGAWVLGVFEGSPTATAYSWCDDCVAASSDLREFLGEHKGRVKVMQFKVGTKMEWEGPDGGHNPFRSKFPFLSDLPTAALFRGRIDTARIIQPKKADLVYLSNRADVFETQVKDGSWKPPKPRPSG